MDETKIEAILKASKEAWSKHQPWESTWQEVADYMMPMRATFTGQQSPGAEARRKTIDSTAEEALEMLAAGLHGMLTSRSQRWFYLQPWDFELRDDHEVLLWLDEVHRSMYSMFNAPSSQFHSQIDQAYMDMGAFGNTVMYSQEGGDAGITYMTRHLSECAFLENPNGIVDTMFRSFKWSCDRVVKQWGMDKLPDSLRQAYKDGKPCPDQRILHVVLPRNDRNYQRLDAKGYPFASLWLLQDHKAELEEGGYQEFPYHVAQWRKRTGEQYGTGPGIRLLPDVRMLNSMLATILKSAQKAVDPPLMVPEQFRGLIRTIPGGLNYFNGNVQGEIKAIDTRARMDIGVELLDRQQAKIQRGFFRDAFDITSDSDGQNVKATFTLQRRDDKFRQLSPTFSYIDVGLLEPLVIRTYNVGLRQNRYPPPPDILDGRKLVVEYVSPVARAMRTAEAEDINRLLEMVAAVGAYDAGAFANINGDEMIQLAGTQLFNVPAGVLRSRDEVKAIRQQQADKDAEQAQLGAAVDGAGALKDVASARKDFVSVPQ